MPDGSGLGASDAPEVTGTAEVSEAVRAAEVSGEAGVSGAALAAAAGLRRRRRPLERAGAGAAAGTWPLASWAASG